MSEARKEALADQEARGEAESRTPKENFGSGLLYPMFPSPLFVELRNGKLRAFAQTLSRCGIVPFMFQPLHQVELRDLRAFWAEHCCSTSSSSVHSSDANSD